MKNLVLILLVSLCFSVHSQITQLYTGTTVTINHLSCAGNTVLIGGLSRNFLAKSYDGGNNLIPLSCPGNTANYGFIQRITSDTVILLSSGYTAELYRSTDGGNNWQKRLDTTIFIPNSFTFFNGCEGIVDYGYGNQVLRTLNGGGAWTLTSTAMPSITMFKSFDSILIMGGLASPNINGAFLVSKDRGHTWPYPAEIMKNSPADFCFFNRDTIFGVSNRTIWGSTFTRSIDGGQSWQIFSEPLYNNDGMARKGSVLYMVGSDEQNIGFLAKSNDLGKSWSSFNTGITSRLKSVIFLNDTIALVSGTNGVLLRWNYSNTVFTDVKEYDKLNGEITLFPNPVIDQVSFEFGKGTFENLKLNITNTLGQLVYSKENFDLKEALDVSFLKEGIYYLELEGDKYYRVFKVVIE